MNILDHVAIEKVEANTAAGQTTVESDFVDLSGYSSVLFFVTVQSVASGGSCSIYAQSAPASDGTGKANEAAPAAIAVADTDDGKVYVLNVTNPDERYVSCVVTRSTADSALGEIYALRYGPRLKNVSQAATVNTSSDV